MYRRPLSQPGKDAQRRERDQGQWLSSGGVPASTLGQNAPGQQVPVASWGENEPLNSFQMMLSLGEQRAQRLIPGFAFGVDRSIAMDFAEEALQKVVPAGLIQR